MRLSPRALFARRKELLRKLRTTMRPAVVRNRGYCPTCDHDVTFIARDPWLRDHYRCSRCGSIPRERALMAVIEERFPHWRDLTVHESSPMNRGASRKISENCRHYIPSHFFPGETPGTMVDGYRCENLERLTFDDASIDLHVTQDVLEHVFRPSQVFREISRTLKPGGAHVFTVPIVNKEQSSVSRARRLDNGDVVHLLPPMHHGNPIDDAGSLVTIDWGFDICRHIFECSGLFTEVVHINDPDRGIRAEYCEVLITLKPKQGGSGAVIP